ncbi:hypothetical protein I4U23_008741 [Adineta vaga]|nr:hypothetical protein I4U23_008741 [Adineta vaga]
METLLQLNSTANTCSFALLWNESTIDSQRPILYVCIMASFTHAMFWLQIICCSALRQKTMQWIYAYLITDILLLMRFFFLFIVHTTSTDCQPNESWYLFISYFEAIFDNYLNILGVYILLALNICRYAQIARNRNVYVTHVRLLVAAHFGIYFIPLILLIIQISVGWAKLDAHGGEICDLRYTHIYVQVFNVLIAFVFPLSCNVIVIYASVRHIHLVSHLRQGRHHVSAREKYHRSLVIQFLVFYTIWMLLWSPNIIVYQLQNKNGKIISICQLLNFIEIVLDPIIIAALDARFQYAWNNVWKFMKRKYRLKSNRNHRQIEPFVAKIIVRTTRHQQVSIL